MKRSLTISLIALALAVIGVAVACGEESSLDDTSWVLESYGAQGAPQSLIADTVITAEFDGSEAMLTGSAGCNSYFSDYAADGSDVTFSTLAWTERACLNPEGVMEQELEYLGVLRDVDRYEVDDTTLRLFYPGGVLVFEAQESN